MSKSAELYRLRLTWKDPEQADRDDQPRELWCKSEGAAVMSFHLTKQKAMDTPDEENYVNNITLERVLVIYGRNRENLTKLLNREDFILSTEPLRHWAKYTPRKT